MQSTAGIERDQRRAGERVTWLGIATDALLIAVKLVAGTLGRSQALVADGVHSASDLVTDFVTLVALRLGRQPEDSEHPYGHGKIEDLAAFVVGLALVAVAGFLVIEAVGGFQAGQAPDRSLWLVVAAAVSVLLKEVLARVTARVARRIQSPSLVANAAHHRSDALSSVAALAGLSLFYFFPDLRWADMAAALLVAGFIVHAGGRIAWQAARDLVDTAPADERVEELRAFVRAMTGVVSLRRLRGRSYAQRMALDLDIEVDPAISVEAGHEIAETLSRRVREEFPQVYQVMVHVEPHDPGQSSPHHRA